MWDPSKSFPLENYKSSIHDLQEYWAQSQLPWTNDGQQAS